MDKEQWNTEAPIIAKICQGKSGIQPETPWSVGSDVTTELIKHIISRIIIVCTVYIIRSGWLNVNNNKFAYLRRGKSIKIK